MQAARLPRLGRAVRTDAALLQALKDRASGHGEVLVHAQRAWASNTFSGARHFVTVAFDGVDGVAGGEQLIGSLPDYDFAIPGQLVAGAALSSIDQRADPPRLVLELEVLLLEDS